MESKCKWFGTELGPWARALLIAAILFHVSMLASWRLGFWNAYTFDTTVTRGWRGYDFFALYQAGHNVQTGISVYESDNDKVEVVVPRYTPYRYLPLPACTVGLVLNLLPPLWAFRLWLVLTEIVYLSCVLLSWRASANCNRAAVIASLWLAFTPYYLEIYMGQFSVVQAALVLVMLLNTMNWSGVSWIASLLWKQNTGLLLPVMVRERKWRLILLAGTVVVAASLPYFLLFPGSLAAFMGNFRAGELSHQMGNLGVRQWLYSLTTSLWPTIADGRYRAIQLGWVSLVLAASLWVTLRDKRGEPWLLICLWMTTFFLLYADVWEHHYVMLLPVWTMLYSRRPSLWVLVPMMLIAIWTPYRMLDPIGWAAFHTPMRWTPFEPRMLDVLYHSSKALPAVGLWVHQLVLLGRSPRRSEI